VGPGADEIVRVLQSTGATGIVDIIRIIPLMRAAVSGWMENTDSLLVRGDSAE